MTETVMSMLRFAVLVLAAGPLVYYLLSLYCTVEYFRDLRRLPPDDDSFAPPVSIVKPVRGIDNGAYENFASYCQLDYPEYELVFAAADPRDPVMPVIPQLQKAFPARSLRFMTDRPLVFHNHHTN